MTYGADMKLAIPMWNNRVSPVFDTAAQVLVVEITGGKVNGRQTLDVAQVPGFQRGEWLARAGVTTVICGAVSSPQEAVLRAAGMDVIPWIRGDIEDVVCAYCSGDLDRKDFRLPGYRRLRRRRRHGRRRRNAINSGKRHRYTGR